MQGKMLVWMNNSAHSRETMLDASEHTQEEATTIYREDFEGNAEEFAELYAMLEIVDFEQAKKSVGNSMEWNPGKLPKGVTE